MKEILCVAGIAFIAIVVSSAISNVTDGLKPPVKLVFIDDNKQANY